MAKIWAISQFDIDQYNFFAATEFFDVTGYGFDRSYHGVRYAEWATLSSGAFIGGRDILDDLQSGNASGSGVVTGLVGRFTPAPINQSVGIEGIAVSIATLMAAGNTPDPRDDLAALRKALSGADSFDLSGAGDLARGYAGNDQMKGNGGGDFLYGNEGNDRLFGGAGNDRLDAGSGLDRLDGGAGRDHIYGGTDWTGDVFDFNAVSDSRAGAQTRDVIYNFTAGSDTIDLSDIRTQQGPDHHLDFNNRTPDDYSIWWTKSAEGVLLQADVSGDAKADFEILLSGAKDLFASDVLL